MASRSRTSKPLGLVPENTVTLSTDDLIAIDREVDLRSKTQEPVSAKLRASGEMAFHRFMGMDDVFTEELRDGARPIALKTVEGHEISWQVQMRTLPRVVSDAHLYIHPEAPLRGDAVVLVVKIDDENFRIEGFIMCKDFRKRAVIIKKNGVNYRAIRADKLSPAEIVYLTFNGPKCGKSS